MVLMEHAFYDNEKAEKQPKAYQRKKEDHEFDILIDIQKKLAQGKGKYYVRFAKNFNTKQVAKAVLYLKQHDIRSYDDLEKNVKTATERFTELSASIKEKEKRLAEIQVLKKHIFDYFKTKDVYADYRKCGYSKKFLEEHRQGILLHKAAKNAFDELHLKKLPKVKNLSAEYAEILAEKKKLYGEYRQVKYKWIINLSGKEFDEAKDMDSEIQITRVLSFEEARAWRKLSGDYVRNRQWNDIEVDIRII